MIKIAKAYTEGFDRAVRRAEKNNVVIVPFDNVLETDKVMRVNENQLDMGCMYAPHVLKELAADDISSGKLLESARIAWKLGWPPAATTGRSFRQLVTGTMAPVINCGQRHSRTRAVQRRCGSGADRRGPSVCPSFAQ